MRRRGQQGILRPQKKSAGVVLSTPGVFQGAALSTVLWLHRCMLMTAQYADVPRHSLLTRQLATTLQVPRKARHTGRLSLEVHLSLMSLELSLQLQCSGTVTPMPFAWAGGRGACQQQMPVRSSSSPRQHESMQPRHLQEPRHTITAGVHEQVSLLT